jgi:DedD protein
MPEPANTALDDARKRARRRLVGAIVLALVAAVVVPLFLESDPKQLGPDVQVQIPAIDDTKFQNRLTPPGKSAADKSGTEKSIPADKTNGAQSGAKTSGVITESGPAKVAPDASAAKSPETSGAKSSEMSGAGSKSADANAPASKPTSEGAATASAPVPPARETIPAAGPKTSAAGSEATSKGAAKDSAKEAAQREAVRQAEAKRAQAKKAVVPEPATNLGTATLNTAPPVAKGDGEFVVQVGAFADRTVATELAAKAGEQGYPVFLEPVTTKSGPIQRVRVGPFATRAAADQAAAKLAAAGFTAVARPR